MSGLEVALAGLWPHLAAVALCAARLLPVAFLSPLLGGQAAPTTVRLGLVLALCIGLHSAGGVAAPDGDAWALAAAALRELAFGTAVGLVASLPFDAARMGGRFIDLFRGTSAEASLPVAGTRESATGDGLYQWLTALAVAAGAGSLTVGALWRTFKVVPLGGPNPGAGMVELVVALAGGAMAAGLAVGAPIAGLALLVDALMGLLGRAAPQLGLAAFTAPVRILLGGAALWLIAGLVCARLLEGVDALPGWIAEAAEGAS